MGNGKSQPVGLEIDEKPFLTNTFYTLHTGSFGPQPERKVTVFEGIVNDKAKFSAVDRFAKNVMVHRHPNILKFVASWNVGEKFLLATEEVQPLQHMVDKQTLLQICVGLHSVLKALNFLHEKALSSHNNVCQSSIYVTPDGQWRLGGVEYLCKFTELDSKFLTQIKQGRYENGIFRGEDERVPSPPSAIDRFAFGVLVEEILKSRIDENVPGSSEFLQVAKNQLQSSVAANRPSFESLLDHPFFNHEFIAIYNFLTELPLKSEVEKQIFFRDLTLKLGEFGEEVVAGQLGALLLSRIVLLDSTAQKFLLPQILNPRIDGDSSNLFSESSFKKYISPKLMSIFCVRDIQVRITLLTYFKSFCLMFTPSELHTYILPELLVGIKDTNDELVSQTLRALSDLVPILGAATVIGGKRAKLFSDGRPKVHNVKGIKKKTLKSAEIENGSEDMFLCERPSPDGGEAPTSPTISEDEVEQWDSWDPTPEQDEVVPIVEPPLVIERQSLPKSTERNRSHEEDEVDFFRDMEPVISKTQVIQISEAEEPRKDRLSYSADEECTGEGWGDDGLEWADMSDTSIQEDKL